MPLSSGRLTPQELAFCEAMETVGDATEAARRAGYAQPHSAGSKLTRRPEVQAEIYSRAHARIRTEGATVAAKVLIEIALDEKAPKAPRVAAARTLAEMTQLGGVQSAADKPLSEMTAAELSAARQKALAYLDALDAPEPIEGTAVEIAAPVSAPSLFD